MKKFQHPLMHDLWSSQMFCEVHKNMWSFLESIKVWDIAHSKKSDSIPLDSHEDPVFQNLRTVDFTNHLWTSQSKNQDTLDPNLCGRKNPDYNRDISRSYTLKYMKICEIHNLIYEIHNFFKSWLMSPMSPTIVYHLCAVLPVVLEISQSLVSAKIHDLKKVPFWGGTMRRIGPRWRLWTYRLILFFAPNESSTRALSVGMLISIRECLNKKFQAFEHFSARKYVRFRST